MTHLYNRQGSHTCEASYKWHILVMWIPSLYNSVVDDVTLVDLKPCN